MTGEIAAAYIALLPSMRGFGSSIVAQAGPDIQTAGRQLGTKAGQALGSSMGAAAAKETLPALSSVNGAITGTRANSEGWLASDAQMAIKNVAIYGGMYGAIQLVGAGIAAAFSDMVGFNSQLQQADIGFTQILGSSANAKQELSWVKDFAKETPFNFQDVLQYDQQLEAMIGNTKEAHDALEAAGDAAAGLGRGSAGVASISLALGQMASKGKIQSQELVLQLSQVGINGVKILADSLGTTTEDIQARMQAGVLDSATYLPVLIAGIEKQYAGLMQKDSATLGGMWSNIQDTLQQNLAAAGKPLFDELTAEAKQGLAALSSPDVQKGLDQFGQLTANGVKDVTALVGWLWNGHDALIAFAAVAGGRALWNSSAVQGFVGNVKAIPAAFTEASTAARAAAESQTYYDTVLTESQVAAASSNASLLARASAMGALEAADRELLAAQGAYQASGVTEISTDARVEAATLARAVAVERLAAAEAEATAAGLDAALSAKQLAAADTASAAAAGANQEAQAVKAKVMGGLKGVLGNVGQIAGIAGTVDGLNRVTTAEGNTAQAAWGVVEATGGAALAGAAFGTTLGPIGTAAGGAVGGVVGLTAALVGLNQAQDAANKDTSGTEAALEHVGVSSATAAQLMSQFTNAQLKSVGGSQAFIDAVQQGGPKLDALIAKLEATEKQQIATANSDQTLADSLKGNGYWNDYESKAEKAAAALQDTRNQLAGLNSAAIESKYTQFANQEALDAATGSYGKQSAAAYAAAQALGTIPFPLEQTSVAAEGASGMVGYLLSALTGLPVNTPINFSTNANDILQQIYQLQQGLAAIEGNSLISPDASDAHVANIQAQIAAQEAALKKALTTSVSVSQAAAKKSGGGSNAAAQAATAAAEAAAQKLKQDQQAQQAFGDAFGSLMKDALAGNFDQYSAELSSEIQSLVRDGYQPAADTLQRLSPALNQAALDYSALTNKLKAASSAESDLTQKMQQQYQTTVDTVTGLAKITDAQSYDQLAYLLSSTTAAATQYQDVLTQLKNEGLSEDLWNQLAQAGPQSIGLAQSILAQGQAGVDQINSLSGSLVDAADNMGDLVSNSMYEQGVAAMEAYINGLNSQSTALENQLAQIANNILAQTAGAITPGNAGYAAITSGSSTVANTYNLSFDASSLGDIKSIQDFLAMLDAQPTTQIVNAAGTVTS